jgi:PKD repeat protein
MFTTCRGSQLWSLLLMNFCFSLLGLDWAQAQVNANFSADITQGCAPLSVRFTDLSTGSIQQWFWDFGNGNTSQFDDVIATYTTPGTYTVSLTVTDTVNGISSTKTELAYITVFAEPTADFTADQTNGCAPFTVNFSDTSLPGDGNIVSWQWDFGDGNIATGASPTHTYVAAGDYTVTMIITDDNGCSDTRIRTDLISITNVASVGFNANPRTACSAPFTVSFNSNVNPSGSYTYLWDFGDGNTSSVPNPNHTYTSNGDFDVSLTITDVNGCSETRNRNNFVLINNPTAAFTALNTTACTGTNIAFLNSSAGADSYLWNFGDGTTSTAANPSHAYALPGTYSVSLTANNSAGCNDTHIETAYITINPSPAASFTSPNNIGCQVPTQVSFTDQSFGSIISWDWNFGNGNVSNAPNPTTTYTAPGSYNVSLTVTSADGCQATETINNFVILTEPDAEFTTSDPDGCLPHTVNFLDLSTSPNDPIVSWVWNFGDGNVSNQQNPTHTYITEGIYNVSLTVTTAGGCQNTQVFNAVEVGIKPNALFDANPRVACVETPIDFTDLTAGNVTNWQWNFGDGNGSTDPNPTHAYQDTGTFDIILIVENLGCFDTLIQQDFITIQGAVADFTMTPTTGCNPPRDIAFFDQSVNANQWLWDFGDGNTSTLQNPVHTYTTVGTFTVTLVATDTLTGCVDNATDVLLITDPVASFSANPLFGCPPLRVNFTNTSVNTTTYLWDFGNGATSTVANPSYNYTQPGDYTVTLIASDGVCSDTLVMPDLVRISGPTVDFSANTLNGCAPLPVTFNDLSVAYGSSSFVNWSWDFGDGTTGSGPNPTHTYANPGTYTVTLEILDSDGCLQSLTKTAYVTATFPTADFVSNDTISCPGALVNFNNLSTGLGLSYLWDFGDGNTSSSINPTHLYPGNGSYNLILTVTDVNGCSDVMAKTAYINIGRPTAAFVADTTSADCPPLLVGFTDQSSPDVVDWYWDFGDGSTSALPNPSKIYAVAGDYTVSLVVTNAQGCQDTLSQPDLIKISGPSGTFSMSPSSGCQPLDVGFTADSPNPAWTYDWDFGDGTGGTGNSIVHTYLVDTIANPIMLIEDANGCIVFVQSPDDIEILPQPQPAFVASITEICLGQSVTFTNNTYSERPVTSYLWDFGDGNTSSQVSPTHVYADTGTYVISLLATTVDGCSDTSAVPLTVRVTTPPTAVFTLNPSRDCVPSPVSFSQSSTGFFPIVDYQWDFGDGTSDNGATIFPHIYATPGIYNPTLTITDSKGCTGSLTRTVTIDPLPPVDFSAFRYGCAPINIAFTDETLGTSPVVSWLWDFGDGNTSNQQNPVHTYANNGNYTVTLTVVDANGCTNGITRTDYVKLSVPTANFISDASPNCPPLTVNFTNLSSGDTTLTYLWNFGNGFTSALQNPSHTYYTSDTFDVSLIVTDPFGCSDTAILNDHVYTHDRPTASFTLSDTTACVPENIVMTSTSSPSAVPIVSYQWDFGSGSGSATPTASHLYTNAGTYTVSLVVADQNGCQDTASRSVIINPNPVANFLAGDTVGCSIATIGFSDLSTGVNAPVAWLWDFGDGKTGTNQNPNNTYFADGTYSVSLKVTDINGCSDSITRVNYIELTHPTAAFTADAAAVCPNTTVNFVDQSNGSFGIVNWAWDFGDGSPVIYTQNPSHIYSTPGSYNVQLIVTDILGCQDTILRPGFINVYSPPTANFGLTSNAGCTPLPVNMSDLSTAGSGSIIGWQWDFGDGNSSLAQNPTHTFNNFGSFTVSLTITDDNSCTATYSENVDALESPVADFIADKQVGCAPEIINFADLSTSPYVIVSWLWDFGDGNTSSLPSPAHTYMNDGIYDVRLVVTDQNGCQDSIIRPNYIRLTRPSPDFTMSSILTCPGASVDFTDVSIPDTTLMAWFWDFGDGNTSTQQNPTHIYSSPGTYTVSLTVTNLLNCAATETKVNILQVQENPIAQFTENPSAGCTPLAVGFTNTTTTTGSPVTSWFWDFGDGGGSPNRDPSYTYSLPGTYRVALIATNALGCTDTFSSDITAHGLPNAAFTASDSLGCAPKDITFVNQSTGPTVITSWQWDFGDGGVSASPVPVHTYNNDGIYDVQLIVSDLNGCTDTLIKPQYIRLSHPVANFNTSQTQTCPGTLLNFSDASIADTTIVSWFWDFGDGNTSSLANPSHFFANPGSYSVSLTVTNVLGCSDTRTRTTLVTVLAPPTAAFTVPDTINCAPFTVSFTDASTGNSSPIVDWAWDFGDGNTSKAKDPVHTYVNAGNYTAILTVTDNLGCSQAVSQNLISTVSPNANFNASDTVGCVGGYRFL